LPKKKPDKEKKKRKEKEKSKGVEVVVVSSTPEKKEEEKVEEEQKDEQGEYEPNVTGRVKVVAKSQEVIDKNPGLTLFASMLDDFVIESITDIHIILADHRPLKHQDVKAIIEEYDDPNTVLVIVIDSCPKAIRSCFQEGELKSVSTMTGKITLTDEQKKGWEIRSENGVNQMKYNVVVDTAGSELALIEDDASVIWILFPITASVKDMDNLISFIFIDNFYVIVSSEYSGIDMQDVEVTGESA